MLDKTKVITGFIFHDPIHNMEEYIESADLKSLKEAQVNGIVFLAEYADGSRTVIEPEEMDFDLLIQNQTFHVNVVEQEVFVPLMNALVDMMDESMTPAVSIMSLTPGVKNTAKEINSKFDVFKNLVQEMNERYEPNMEENENGEDQSGSENGSGTESK